MAYLIFKVSLNVYTFQILVKMFLSKKNAIDMENSSLSKDACCQD